MNLELVLDPAFRIPFVVGLIMSTLLPLLGNLLRLRDAGLAALGLAHLSGATGLVGLAVGIPIVLGAPLGALGGAAIKALSRFRGNTVYAMMVLIGWCTTILVAANSPIGDLLGHALTEGQLYFVGDIQLAAAAGTAVLAAVVLPLVSKPVIRARLLPRLEVANRLPAWHWHFGFDALAALAMAIGTGTVGLMGAFALAFMPPLAAFRVARTWRQSQWLSVGIGVSSYFAAFLLALVLDQPFGPMLVATLILITTGTAVFPRALLIHPSNAKIR
jgi:zinc transport system permease protein